MSDDDELALWKQKRLLEMQRKLLARKVEPEPKPEKILTPEQKLFAVLAGRAKEIYETSKRQFPQATQKVTEALAKLIDQGELSGPISGEELFAFFRMIGLRVKLETRISYVEDGKIKTLAEKMRKT